MVLPGSFGFIGSNDSDINRARICCIRRPSQTNLLPKLGFPGPSPLQNSWLRSPSYGWQQFVICSNRYCSGQRDHSLTGVSTGVRLRRYVSLNNETVYRPRGSHAGSQVVVPLAIDSKRSAYRPSIRSCARCSRMNALPAAAIGWSSS